MQKRVSPNQIFVFYTLFCLWNGRFAQLSFPIQAKMDPHPLLSVRLFTIGRKYEDAVFFSSVLVFWGGFPQNKNEKNPSKFKKNGMQIPLGTSSCIPSRLGSSQALLVMCPPMGDGWASQGAGVPAGAQAGAPLRGVALKRRKPKKALLGHFFLAHDQAGTEPPGGGNACLECTPWGT